MKTWEWIGLALGICFVIALIVGWTVVAVGSRRTPEEQRREDEEQMKYLQEWSAKRQRGK